MDQNVSLNEIPIDRWVEMAEQTLADVASAFLGCRVGRTKALSRVAPQGLPGAHVALMSSVDSVHIGLLSTDDGCQGIAKQMLGLDDADTTSVEEVADAMGEVLNILAGSIKGGFAKDRVRLTVGTPCYSDDPLADIMMFAEVEVASCQVCLGSIDAILLVAYSG